MTKGQNMNTMPITTETELEQAKNLLHRIREACRANNHPITSSLGCGYCIEIGEILSDS